MASKKVVLDQFYTHPNVVNECLTIWDNIITLTNNDLVIEPSAGTGAFSSNINCIAYDLDPKDPNIIQQDFLKLDLTIYGNNTLNFIGNPPFGKSSQLAFAFINKITDCPQTNSFAFILPVSFNREWVQNRINPYFHLKESIYVNDFIANGKNKKVKCCFQVWVKEDKRRELFNMKPQTNLITFVSDPTKEYCDFKIGNKKTAGHVYIGTHTSIKENKTTYKGIIVHNDKFKKILRAFARKNKRLFKANLNDFVASPSLTQAEVINACEFYYNKYKDKF